MFTRFIAQFVKAPPTFETVRNEVYGEIYGITGLRILTKLKDQDSEFRRLMHAFGDIAFPEAREEYRKTERKKRQRKSERKQRGRKAVMESDHFWQLEGESDLNAAIIPHPPKCGAPAIVRLTHSNSEGPFDKLEFFVRVGDPDEPTEQNDLDSANDWVPARLVEELVFLDGKEELRSEVDEPFDGSPPWWGTYEAPLMFPKGKHSVEIKIVSLEPDLHNSGVLTDWLLEVK
jgi:hypothetical protein